MKNRILKTEGNRLVLVENTPVVIDSTVNASIHLPRGAVFEKLTIEGRVNKCVQVTIDRENRYLLEVDISHLTEAGRLILQAYMDYLESEKQVDEIRTSLDFEDIITDILEGKEEGLYDNAIQEYLVAWIKNIPFH